jgi:hypothetical protein
MMMDHVLTVRMGTIQSVEFVKDVHILAKPVRSIAIFVRLVREI